MRNKCSIIEDGEKKIGSIEVKSVPIIISKIKKKK